MAKKRTTTKRSKKKKGTSLPKLVVFSVLALLVVVVAVFVYEYRDGVLYYLGYKSKHSQVLSPKDREVHDIRIYEVLSTYKEKTIGIDVSQYQGVIDWSALKKVNNDFVVDFVIIRSTAGKDKVDEKFKYNWKNTKGKYIRGAYHYYRPNENSLLQAENFIKTVKLSKGDLPPILDIEKLPETQSIDSLKVGLKRWLTKIEKHYKVKPIIYSGESYYNDFLKEEFLAYTFWIANYNFWRKEMDKDWLLWQFTEKAQVNGINGLVDVNVFDGIKLELMDQCVK
ncbi:GH25 family lysozyme [uncultured Flavobacterium sp.]|uniref:GH25 family lysozyme n=1 Tax=uncultured Flavobacterium sp. TaxID=165435 RepID=UPI0030C7FC93